jgi:sugar/nucleoside kinase (ribokinase family)
VDLIAFGPVFVEMVFGTVPALPGPGEEIYSDTFVVSAGGSVSVAGAACEAGATAGLATTLGDDLGTRVVEAYCHHAGVDLGPCRYLDGEATGVTVVLNYSGDRSFISHLPPATGEAPAWWPAIVRDRHPAWVYLDSAPGAWPVIEEAKRAGSRIAVDTELDSVRRFPDYVRKCVAAADIFVPNRRELAELAGTDDLAGAVAAIGAANTTVVVKEGSDGASVCRDGVISKVMAGLLDVDVLDRTGAGDAFAGAMIGTLARGADIVEAVATGNNAGSRAVARLGAIGSVRL